MVVTNRNYAAYITAALKSVSEQTHREMSLIVGDDCSSDDSAIQIEQFMGASAGRFRTAVARYSEYQRGKNGLLNWLLPTVETRYTLIVRGAKLYSRLCSYPDHSLASILPLREDLAKGTKHDKYKRLVRAGYWGTHVPLPLFEYRMHDMNISGIGQRIQEDVRSGRRPNAFSRDTGR